MKKNFNTNYAIALLTIIIGISFILYPIVSNYVNTYKHNKLIKNYISDVDEIDEEQYIDILADAKKYNDELYKNEINITSNIKESEKEIYNQLLNINNTGIMGYIEIAKIKVMLPIYHGTSTEVLQAGAGHIENSSLPIGGNNTHSIISGHTGLPSSKIFTDISKLKIGDTFTIKILQEVLTYEVDQIEVVEPIDVSLLQIEEGKDYVTLVTCTPYGINTHRLLVRGHRIETPETENNNIVTNKPEKKQPYILIIICTIVVATLILIMRKLYKRMFRRIKRDSLKNDIIVDKEII